jgi:hypothetical protein
MFGSIAQLEEEEDKEGIVRAKSQEQTSTPNIPGVPWFRDSTQNCETEEWIAWVIRILE